MRGFGLLLAGVGLTAACAVGESARTSNAPASSPDGNAIGAAVDLAPVRHAPFHAAGDVLTTSGSTFVASVARAGTIDVSPRRFGPFLERALTLETISITRGERELADRGTAMLDADGSVVVTRGDVLERVVNDGGGIEQSWRFEREPSNSGDLVVRVRATGLPYQTATRHGLHFDGLRYGTATWIDARGRRTPVVARFVDGAIAIVVPDVVVAGSAFPAVLDPTVTAEKEIDTPVAVGAAPGSQYNPAVTAIGPGQGYFAVWSDYRGTRNAYFGARIASNGTVTDTTGIVVANAVAQATPGIYHSTDGLLLVWTVTSYYDSRQEPGVYALRLDKTGKAIDTEPVTIAAKQANIYQTHAASDGSNWFITWYRTAGANGYEILGVRLPAAGAPLDVMPVSIGTQKDYVYDTQIDFDGTAYLTTWQTNTNIYGQRVGTDGKNVGAPVTLASTPGSSYEHTLASDRTNKHFLAYVEYGTNTYPLNLRRFDKNLAALDGGSPTPLQNTSEYPEGEILSFDGTNFLATWTSGQKILGTRVTPAGAIVDTPVPTLVTSTQYLYAAPSAADGPGGVALYYDYGTGAALDDIKLVKIDPTTTPFKGVAPPTLVTQAANSETTPATAWNGTSYFAVWADTREANETIWGAQIGADGSPAAPVKVLANPNYTGTIATYTQISAPRIASNGSTFLVTWSAYNQQTSERGIYGAVVDASGAVQGGLKKLAVPPLGGPLDYDTLPDVAWDGTNYLVVYQEQTNDGYGIGGKRIKPDGTEVDGKVIRLSPFSPGGIEQRVEPSVGFDGTRYFVAWVTTRPSAGGSLQVRHVYGTRVETDGTPVESELVVCDAFLLQRTPRVSGDAKNGGFFVVWEDYRTSLDNADIYGGRISTKGEVLDGDKGAAISTGDTDESVPTVAPSLDGTNWIVAWRDLRSKQGYDIYGAWISVAGKNHDPKGLLLSAETGDEETPQLTGSAPGKHLLTYARLETKTGYGSYRVRARTIDSGKLVGQTCQNADDCASRSCVDGFCCATECDGCGTCSATPGACTPRPAGSDSPRCTYKCKGTLDCPKECTDNSDCANGATCDKASKQCVTRTICTDATHLQDVTGKQTDCAPYVCVGDACRTNCGSVDDCAAGFVCDHAGRCVPPPNAGDVGGCAVATDAEGPADATWAIVVAAALVIHRRRPRRQP